MSFGSEKLSYQELQLVFFYAFFSEKLTKFRHKRTVVRERVPSSTDRLKTCLYCNGKNQFKRTTGFE